MRTLKINDNITDCVVDNVEQNYEANVGDLVTLTIENNDENYDKLKDIIKNVDDDVFNLYVVDKDGEEIVGFENKKLERLRKNINLVDGTKEIRLDVK